MIISVAVGLMKEEIACTSDTTERFNINQDSREANDHATSSGENGSSLNGEDDRRERDYNHIILVCKTLTHTDDVQVINYSASYEYIHKLAIPPPCVLALTKQPPPSQTTNTHRSSLYLYSFNKF